MRHRPTRRFILCAFTAFLPQAAAAGSGKKSKAQVAYLNRPRGTSSCASCSFFQAPRACAVVEGVVIPNGWCKLYAAVD